MSLFSAERYGHERRDEENLEAYIINERSKSEVYVMFEFIFFDADYSCLTRSHTTILPECTRLTSQTDQKSSKRRDQHAPCPHTSGVHQPTVNGTG